MYLQVGITIQKIYRKCKLYFYLCGKPRIVRYMLLSVGAFLVSVLFLFLFFCYFFMCLIFYPTLTNMEYDLYYPILTKDPRTEPVRYWHSKKKKKKVLMLN